MRSSTVLLIARHEWTNAFRTRSALVLTVILGVALLTATLIGWQNYATLNGQRQQYQNVVRAKWLEQPDRHPHRVSHYGYLVFRPKSELSFFDFGIESYAGVSIFLEAHRQNTANFSEAGFSGGLMRFGELSVAMVLQLLVPLLIFFLGFSSIAGERERGTLKLLLCQGASWRAILLGKTAGIVAVTFALFAPVVISTLGLWAVLSAGRISADSAGRVVGLLTSYALYFIACASVAILISALHQTARSALTTLVVIWIFFGIVLPKATQTLGTKRYPAPSKAEFDAQLEADLGHEGDGHNPDDPHFTQLRAATLRQYGVGDVNQLPFNYNGLVMMEAEKISSGIFRRHFGELIETFGRQNRVTEWASFANPYLAIRQVSMALAGSSFAQYTDFQQQAEAYRYRLTQQMNQLHTYAIRYDKNLRNDRAQRVSRQNWQQQPPFTYRSRGIGWALAQQKIAVAAVLFWFVAGLGGLRFIAKRVSTL